MCQVEEDELIDNGREECEKVRKTMAWATCDGAVPVMRALR